MADIFVSYARADKQRVAPLVAALESQGWSIWWDPEINPGQEFDRQISAALDAAKAVLVVWTPLSVESRWVRGEAREAADRGILVPVRFDNARLPIDARSLHTTDLDDWKEDAHSRPFQDMLRALRGLLEPHANAERGPASTGSAHARGLSICVLPFTNMSGDPEQEYFSDGISEDIITDLSKVSALSVAPRNTAFTYKGKAVDVAEVGRQMKVRHVLEGSVRRSGNKVRITAQLIDCADNNHIWAERYDRNLSDIFALQDEISRAIVAALKVRLLPEERQTIGRRGTSNPEAYRLVLMARQHKMRMSSSSTDPMVGRLYKRATELDPNYALAWAQLAREQFTEYMNGLSADNGLAAVERALSLDPNLAEAHSSLAWIHRDQGRVEEALKEHTLALSLDPESYEANREAGITYLQLRRFDDAIVRLEKASELAETDYKSLAMAVQGHQGKGDLAMARDTARRAMKRLEAHIAQSPSDAQALSLGASTLAAMGDAASAKDWAAHAILVAPDDRDTLYNLACTMIILDEIDTALDYLDFYFKSIKDRSLLAWSEADSDLDAVRALPRYKAMFAAAKSRLAGNAPAPETT